MHDDNLTVERPTFVTHLECRLTGERYPADEVHNLSRAGKPLLVRYDLDGVRKALSKEALERRPLDFWRYRELLPVRRAQDIVSLGEAVTPLIAMPKLAARGRRGPAGQGRGPAADRLVQGARASDGSVDGESARRQAHGDADQRQCRRGARRLCQPVPASSTTIFCPEDTPEVNVSEIALQGATRLPRQRPDRRLRQARRRRARPSAGWFDTSTLKEPYRIEGKKTMGLELAEQLGWRRPDVILYPTGGGTGLIGMWKAFAELEAIGFIGKKRPRMVAVQAAGCAPIVRAYEAGEEHAPRWDEAHTIASGIRVPQAVGDFLILRAVRESGGYAVAVADHAISAAIEEIARREGFLMCPEGAATYAALKLGVADGRIRADEQVVLFNCATGLKYPLPPMHRVLDRFKPMDFATL